MHAAVFTAVLEVLAKGELDAAKCEVVPGNVLFCKQLHVETFVPGRVIAHQFAFEEEVHLARRR